MANVQQKRKRQPYRKFNVEVISALAKKYGVTENFTRISVNNLRGSELANEIRREYNRTIKEIQKSIAQQIDIIKDNQSPNQSN